MNFRNILKKITSVHIALLLLVAALAVAGIVYRRNSGNEASLQQQIREVSDDVQSAAVMETAPNSTTPTLSTIPDATAPSQKAVKTQLPLEGETVSAYAMDCLSYNETTRDWRVHEGMDIAAEAGTQVQAAADGVVYSIYEDDRLGTTVVLRHDNGYFTRYSSLAKEPPVTMGQSVSIGECIGIVDNSALTESAIGCHLHFAVTQNDKPVDPCIFLGTE